MNQNQETQNLKSFMGGREGDHAWFYLVTQEPLLIQLYRSITHELHRAVLESVNVRDVNFFGTPFVTCVNTEQPLSGYDIDAIISVFLFPLQRVKADAAASAADDASDGELSFRIFLTDERYLDFKPFRSDSSVNPPGLVTRILVEWSDDEHAKYDASYLRDLPEVYRTSFFEEKTKQEAISLFSCLDAYLAEEPLGPEW